LSSSRTPATGAGATTHSARTRPVDRARFDELLDLLAKAGPREDFEVFADEALAGHSTLRIGGPADLFLRARTQKAVRAALAATHDLDIPVLLLGGGSNLLISDEGWRGVVLHVACDRMEFGDDECWVEAGADFLEFIQACCERGLSGLEFAAGVPGSVGGAIYGNAGCYGKAVGEFVVEAYICDMDGANPRLVPASFFSFDYRDTRLKHEPKVILGARIRLVPASREEIQAVIDSRLEERRVKHPDWRNEPTAGSYFKNLPAEAPGEQRVPAGKLLDQLQCRGLRIGDAQVFDRHANIIVNVGSATAQEVLTLAEVMRARARREFHVELEEEVLFVGPRPPLLPHPDLEEPSPTA
jgi:UDP-N-acetylmuramate dehydrogenase